MPKGRQTGPKVSFIRLHKKLMHGTFLIFCMKFKQHKGLKLTRMIFWKKSWTVVLDKKWPKMSFVVTN